MPERMGQANKDLMFGYYAKTPGEKVTKLNLSKFKLP
jgi:hypothetical protein